MAAAAAEQDEPGEPDLPIAVRPEGGDQHPSSPSRNSRGDVAGEAGRGVGLVEHRRCQTARPGRGRRDEREQTAEKRMPNGLEVGPQRARAGRRS